MEHDISHIKDIGDIMNIFLIVEFIPISHSLIRCMGNNEKLQEVKMQVAAVQRDTLTISASGKEKLVKNTNGRTHNTNVDKSIDLKSYIASAQKTNQK